MKEYLKQLKSIPNMITLSRIFFAFLAITYIENPLKYLFFGLTILSDGVDGFVARKFDMKTDLGRLLDPAVDKAVAALIFFALVPLAGLELFYIPLFFTREIFEALVGIFHVTGDLSEDAMKARFPGKIVTNFQFLTVVALLVPHAMAARSMIWLVFLSSVVSIGDYTNFLIRDMDMERKVPYGKVKI